MVMKYGLVGAAITTADLGHLPTTPSALVRYLAHLGQGAYFLPLISGPKSDMTTDLNPIGADTSSQRAFAAIAQLLDLYFLTPARVAELYRALGDIPGVTIDTHATDIAGRHGVAFVMSLPADTRLAIVLNPRTYRFMGYSVGDLSGRASSGDAVLRQVPVAAPGVRP